VGAVVHEADTALKPPFVTSHQLVQKGIDGIVFAEKAVVSWN
jgi:hypothetical protein